MKQAYLITAYKNFDELYELAEILSKTAYVFIHVDEKSREITDADVEKLNRLPGCEAIREYRIVWGGFAHVQAIVKLMAMALSKEDVSYMHLLTGEDFPLLTPEQLDEKFLTSDQIFMDYLTPEQLPETVTKRYQYYNWFTDQNVKNKVLWQLQNMTVKVQKKESGLLQRFTKDLCMYPCQEKQQLMSFLSWQSTENSGMILRYVRYRRSSSSRRYL